MASKKRLYLRAKFSDERTLHIRRRWKTYDSHEEILDSLNAMPGKLINHWELRAMASILGLKRPIAMPQVREARKRSRNPVAVATALNIFRNNPAPRPVRKKRLPPTSISGIPKPKSGIPKPLGNQRHAPGLTMGRVRRSTRKRREKKRPTP